MDRESSIGRYVAVVDDREHKDLMAQKAKLPNTRVGGAYNPQHVEWIERLSRQV